MKKNIEQTNPLDNLLNFLNVYSEKLQHLQFMLFKEHIEKYYWNWDEENERCRISLWNCGKWKVLKIFIKEITNRILENVNALKNVCIFSNSESLRVQKHSICDFFYLFSEKRRWYFIISKSVDDLFLFPWNDILVFKNTFIKVSLYKGL